MEALNRTIEGLEARIEGLIGQVRERKAERDLPRERSAGRASDPLTEIVERQRKLIQPRDRAPQTQSHQTQSYQAQPYQPPVAQAPARHESFVRDTDIAHAFADISDALAGLRAELKSGLSDGLPREIAALRDDVAHLRGQAGSATDQDWIRDEFDRLGSLIDRLGREARPADMSPLKAEFAELRDLIARKASQESLSRLEARLDETGDAGAMREEIVALAWRLDEMKASLGNLDSSPAIRRLEDRLIGLAKVVEEAGQARQDDQHLVAQFATLDQRLDEISRAIAASSRTRGEPDRDTLNRLEERLTEMAQGLERRGSAANEIMLIDRLEELSDRVSELAERQIGERLEKRLVQLSAAIDSHQGKQADPEVTFYLADLSRKIDGLDQSGSTAGMIERLDRLAARLDSLDQPAARATVVAAPADEAAFERLESRLADIARRLDDAAATPAAPTQDLGRLEQQIAHLSSLFAAGPAAPTGLTAAVEDRMAQMEQTLAANDEYILEAARQAAEAVVEAFARSGGPAAAPAGDIAALSALADDLKALEDFARSSDERNWRTFEALHETLVNISDRLNDLDSARDTPEAMQARIQAAVQQPVAQQPVVQPARPVEPTAAASVEEEPVRTRMPRADMPALDDIESLIEPAPATARPARSATMVPVLEEDLPETAAETAIVEPDTALADDKAADAAEPPPSKSLFVNLGRKLLGKTGKKPAPARTIIDPTPALDATDMVPAERANDLIEPGANRPELRQILDRVRASKGGDRPERNDDRSDVIAAARRAAEAAAAEVAASEALAPKKGAKPAKPAKDKPVAAGGSKLQENRRPILLAAGAILLVIMSYPLVSNLMGGREAPEQAQTDIAPLDAVEPQATTTETAQADSTADQATASRDIAPVAVTEPAAEAVPDMTAEAAPDAKPADSAAEAMLEPVPSTSQAGLEPSAKDDAVPQYLPEGDKAAEAAPADAQASIDPAAAAPEAKPADSLPELPAGLASPELADAVKKGDALALFEIGARYTDGRGVTLDLAKAAEWYRKSADAGFAPAQYRLANFYEKGTGLERDIAKAKALYEQAAQQGNASAMHNLAVLYAAPSDTAPDYAAAVKWFEQAANLGIADSQFNLAILYARGNGVNQDLVQSYKWFAIAAKAGDKDAAQKRDEVANVLKKDQLDDAKAQAELWKPQPLDPASNAVTVPDAWVGKPGTTASIDVKKAIRNIQAILNNNGFDSGKPDGEMGNRTISAIKAFQKSVGLEPTGRIDDALVKALLERNKKG